MDGFLFRLCQMKVISVFVKFNVLMVPSLSGKLEGGECEKGVLRVV